MANYTLPDLLLVSTGAILVKFELYIKNSNCMSSDADDSRCHDRSFSMEKKNSCPSMALTIMGQRLLRTAFISQSTHAPLKSCF